MSARSPALHGFAGVVLAAGESRRMGRAKAALEVGGQAFLARGVAAAAAAGLDPIVVVVRQADGDVVAALPAGAAVQLVVNPQPERGQLSSLQIALRYLLAAATPPRGAVVGLLDHPLVEPATIAALVRVLAADAAESSMPLIAVPRHRDRRGHPIAYRREVWAELLAAPLEAGVRPVVRRDPRRVVEVEVDDAGILDDVDTPADYERLLAQHSRARR